MTEPEKQKTDEDAADVTDASKAHTAEQKPSEEKKHGFFSRGKFIPPEKPKALPSEKEIVALREKAEQADKLREQLLRLSADFDNYRKRMAREREDNATGALETTLKKLLPVLDDFDRASATVQDDGALLVFGKFRAALIELGLEEIKTVGEKFDPHQHEAIAHTSHDTYPEEVVIEQTRKGYKLRDKLLRAASVVVSSGRPVPSTKESQ